MKINALIFIGILLLASPNALAQNRRTIPKNTSKANAQVHSGRCGEAAYWTMRGDVLTISGRGTIIRPGHGGSNDNDESFKLYWEKARKVIIESGITNTGEFTFYKCPNVESVSLSNTLREIGYCSFEGTSIEKIVIPDGVTSINQSAFSSCKSLKSVNIPNTVTSIGDAAFSKCEGLESITIPNSVTNIGKSAFYYCISLKSISIPNSVTHIGESAFYGCDNLTSVSLSSSLKCLEEFLFNGCKSLTSIKIPNSVEEIKNNVFRDCPSLKTLSIPNSVRTLSTDAFGTISDDNSRCVALKELIVPDNPINFTSDYNGTFFYGIPNVEIVKGQKNLYPLYFFDHLVDSSPFKKNIVKKKNSFSFFAYNLIYPQIEQWQKKKPFETTEQWRQRVTEGSQKNKVNELMQLAKKYYVIIFPKIISWQQPSNFESSDEWKKRITIENQWKKVNELMAEAKKEVDKGGEKTFREYGSLGAYDADYSSYQVTIYPNIPVFVNVPVSDAEEFKDKWEKVKIMAQYGVVGDTLSVTDCTFTLGKKTYKMLQGPKEDPSSDLAFDVPSIDLGLDGQVDNNRNENTSINIATDRSIDTDIPITNSQASNTFVVIIGNENYQQVAKVQYAANDAKVFGEYCQKTLGVPAQNIRKYSDATYGTMLTALQDIRDITNAYDGQASVIFYYAGHGVPSESDQRAYLLPVDADGKQTKVCLPLADLYKELGTLKAKSVVAFIDACFSGSQRGDGMLASARGVAIKPKAESPQGNLVVFSAASDNETAYPYKDKGHGMFTYFLLKDLQQTKGETTLGDLIDSVTKNVKQQSVVINRKPQTPTVISSPSIAASWRSIKL